MHDFWVRTGLREQVTRDLRREIPKLAGTVLDVGGGRTAPHDDAWNERLRRVRIDISPTHRPDVVADAMALPIREESVDAVVMSQLLEHLTEPDRAVAEAHRVLRPGGTLVGSVPFLVGIHGDPADYFRYTESGLRHLLGRFREVTVRPLGNHLGAAWSMLAARSRMLRLLNPAMRLVGRKPEPESPQGYAFTAVK